MRFAVNVGGIDERFAQSVERSIPLGDFKRHRIFMHRPAVAIQNLDDQRILQSGMHHPFLAIPFDRYDLHGNALLIRNRFKGQRRDVGIIHQPGLNLGTGQVIAELKPGRGNAFAVG